MKSIAFASFIFFLSFIVFGCTSFPEKSSPKSEEPARKQDYYINYTVGYKVPVDKSWKLVDNPETDIMMINLDGTFTPPPSINIVTLKSSEYDLWDKTIQKRLKDEIDKELVTASEENLTLHDHKAYKIVYGLENDAVSKIVTQIYLFHNGYFMVITCASRELEFNRFDMIFTNLINKIEFD